MASKNDGIFIAFCDELRAYVEEHRLFPQKHSRLSHKIKYTCKKINDGTLEDDCRKRDAGDDCGGIVIMHRVTLYRTR